MFKRDNIFYAACAVFAVGLVLGFIGYDLALLFVVAAYLLRPTLHSFGMARQYADERQLQIHSKSGNVAFIVVIMATVGFALLRIAKGELAEEMYSIIAIGLAARALVGLLMAGDLRRAGAVIITAIGILLGAFIVLDAGLSAAGLFGIAVAALIAGVGWLARRFPRTIAVILVALAVMAVLGMSMYQFREINLSLWLLGVTPMLTAAACLWLSRNLEREDGPSSRRIVRAILLSAGSIVAIVFVITIARTTPEPGSVAATAAPNGEVQEIQDVACVGRIEYYADGKLESCLLAREDTLFGQVLPDSTTIHLNPDGTLDWCFLPHDYEIDGHLCRGQGHGFMTGFHANGRLRTAWLARDEVIQGIPCARFVFPLLRLITGGGDGTYFYNNGQLASCRLSEDHTIDGRLYEKGTLLRFDRDGRLIPEKQEKQ